MKKFIALVLTSFIFVGCGNNFNTIMDATHSDINLTTEFTEEFKTENLLEDEDIILDNQNITLYEYSMIYQGMSYEEVVNIIGSYGEPMANSSFDGYSTDIYQWSNVDGGNMIIMFVNKEVYSKSQAGLK